MDTNKRLKDAMLFNILSFMSNQLLGQGKTAASIDELYLFLTNMTAIEYIRNAILREQQNARFSASVSLGSSQTFNARNRTSEVQISRFCGSYSGSVTFSAGFRSTSSHFFAWLKQLRIILLMSRIVPGVTSRPSWDFLFVETALVF